jgi:hypothetical protein
VAVAGLIVGFGPFTLPADNAPWMWALFALAIVAALLLGGRGNGRRSAGTAIGVVAVLVLELGLLQVHSVGRRALTDEPFTDYRTPFADELSAGGRTLAITRDDLGNFPYLGASLRPNANVYQGVRNIDGYDGGVQVTARWVEAMTPLAAGPTFEPELTLRAQIRLPLDPAQFARFGVRDVLLDVTLAPAAQAVPGWDGPVAADGPLEVWRNPAFAGEAHLEADGRVENLVENLVVDRTAGSQRIDVESAGAPAIESLLVTDEQWDPGWTVRVDGEAATTQVVDRFFLGVRLPPGEHRITFDYRVVHGRLGLALSALGLVIAASLVIANGRPIIHRPRRRRGAHRR